MKKFLLLIIGLFLILTACSSEPPSIRVINRRTTKANVQVKPTSGNTININDVAAGQTSSYQDISEGYCQATATLQSESASPYLYFTVIKGRKYSIVILEGLTPSLRIDDEGDK